MNRMRVISVRLCGVLLAASVFCAGLQAQGNPFAPQAAPPLPPGMTGSTTNDPRVGLKPGLYDAGEAASGMQQLDFVKKPAAFQLSGTNPDDPAVQKALSLLGVANSDKMPKPLQLVIAQLAFANSDFAFQGNHLFQGNFYGVNFYDISNPAKISLITSLICPGGQGDVSVYSCSCRSRCQMAVWTAVRKGSHLTRLPPQDTNTKRQHLPQARTASGV